jgi:hypothetical protein
MLRFSLTAAAAAAVSIAVPATASPSKPQTTFSASGGSSAAALDFTLSGIGSPISLINQVYASGSTPGKYSKTTSLPIFALNKSYSGGAVIVKGSGKGIVSTASSAGVNKSGTLITTATARIGSFTATVGSPLGTDLTIVGSNITSTASSNGGSAGISGRSSSVTIGNIAINSKLFGITNASYKGSPGPNKIIYQSKDKTVTVVANYETTTTTSIGTKFVVDAIAILINKYKYGAYTLSGEIALGASTSSITLFPVVQ